MKTISDLLERLQRDDQTVYKELFDVHFMKLRNSYQWHVRDIEDFKDVYQEAVTQLWQQRYTFKNSKHVVGCFYIIVACEAIRVYNKSKHLQPLPDMDVPDYEGHPDRWQQETTRFAFIEEVYQAIERLSKQQRKVLTLSYIDGKSHKAIALKLNISVNTVRGLKKQGLDALRKYFATNNGGPAFDLLVITLLQLAQHSSSYFFK